MARLSSLGVLVFPAQAARAAAEPLHTEAYEELLAPEIPRERALWGTDESVWRMKMEQLREFIRDHDPQHLALERFCDYWGVPDETRRSYFGW